MKIMKNLKTKLVVVLLTVFLFVSTVPVSAAYYNSYFVVGPNN